MTRSVAIVGAGPAGLAARSALGRSGVGTITFDAGIGAPRERPSLLEGIGGAGLYSDGKFSFRPSATMLWHLQPAETLRAAEADFVALFEAHGGAVPKVAPAAFEELHPTAYRRKKYPSVYLPFEARLSMIEELAAAIETGGLVEGRVSAIEPDGGRYVVTSDIGESRVDGVVLATGRLGILPGIGPDANQRLTFRRYELGVRLETPTDMFPLGKFDSVDPKLIGETSSRGVSWRTFCACRDGRVERCDVRGGGVLYSGRADCPPTGFSNFGLLVRFEDRTTAAESDLERIVARAVTEDQSFDVDLEELSASDFSAVRERMGDAVVEVLRIAVGTLLHEIPADRLREVRVVGPCIEGVGSYPLVGEDLSIEFGSAAFVAGDGAGVFRGLVAALISGFFVGRRLAERLAR